MRLQLISIFFILFAFTHLHAQIVTTNPAIFTADQSVTITYDATQGNGALTGVSPVFMHAGVVTSGATGTTWTNVQGTWGSPTSAKGQMTAVSGQPNKWQITLVPRTYFNVAAGTPIYRIGMVFREAGPCGGFNGNNTDCKKGGTAPNAGDIYIDVSQGGFEVAFTQPATFPLFADPGQTLTIAGASTQSASLKILINGNEVAAATNATTVSVDHVVVETGAVTVTLSGNNGSVTKEKSIEYLVRNTLIAPRPPGVKDGINYTSNDNTRVTLGFLAPLKNTVYVVGDFTNWEIDPAFQMNKDGEHFWLEIDGLTDGVEYAYQYLVDENLYVADPFADKFLDPANDQYISSTTYPNLKPYPSKASGIVSVLQTGQVDYEWQTTGYVRPAKEKLNVYELLIRDWDTPRTYQSVIDRLDYLEALGINAIELMPIMEFSGNDSWGYNPIFYLAPDKAYGPKNKLKELIDKAHQRGMAVILDMVLNQADYEFPYVKMYWDVNKPAADNPWFYPQARHPFNVFFDFKHDSPYTQSLVDSINRYWISEYKFDGFRFDLSKGFCTTNYCTTATCDSKAEVDAWSSYDATRIAILQRMAGKIWEIDPQAYVILEHLGVDSEERELANSGMMLWGNMTGSFKQNTYGYASDSDISRTYYKNRSGSPWNNPASIVAYMESHDEERVMYDNYQYGNSVSGYNAKSKNTALERMKGAFAFLFAMPGPKMIWQFGELGYDISIYQGGRTSPKPIKWDYLDDPNRARLYSTVSEIIGLRNQHDVFHTSSITFNVGNDLYKSIVLRNEPYTDNPQSADEMNVVLIGNFDVTAQSRTVTFPHTGKWYHYFSPADSLQLASAGNSITLQPGEFRLYTDYKLDPVEEELIQYARPVAPAMTSLTERDKTIDIIWQDNSVIESGYRVFRSKGNEPFAMIKQATANTIVYNDRSIFEPLTQYRYYVQAYTVNGTSNSDTLSILTSEDIVTAVNDYELNEIAVHPNPTTGMLVIEGLYSTTDFQVSLLTTQGTVANSRWNSHTVDISDNRPGIYILQVQTQRGIKTIKVVLTK